jgi:hypothetical protein
MKRKDGHSALHLDKETGELIKRDHYPKPWYDALKAVESDRRMTYVSGQMYELPPVVNIVKRENKSTSYQTSKCDQCEGTGRVKSNFYARQRRERMGLSLRTVARLMNISAAYLSDLELGRRPWSEKLIKRFQGVLGV